MEIMNEIMGRKYRLPVGYRFDPTDDILVGYYLKKRIFDQPLPNDLIQDCDVFQTVPRDLPGGGKHLNWQRFVFHDTSSRVFEEPDKRGAGNGQWRMVEKEQEVELSCSKDVVGKKNILAYWETNGDSFTKTNWVMHELLLAQKSNSSPMSPLAVYRIFEVKEKRKRKKARKIKEVTSNNINGGVAMDVTPTVIDFTVKNDSVTAPPSPMSPETP